MNLGVTVIAAGALVATCVGAGLFAGYLAGRASMEAEFCNAASGARFIADPALHAELCR